MNQPECSLAGSSQGIIDEYNKITLACTFLILKLSIMKVLVWAPFRYCILKFLLLIQCFFSCNAEHRKAAREARIYSEMQLHKTGKRPVIYPYTCGRFCCSPCCGCKEVGRVFMLPFVLCFKVQSMCIRSWYFYCYFDHMFLGVPERVTSEILVAYCVSRLISKKQQNEDNVPLFAILKKIYFWMIECQRYVQISWN